MPPAPSPKFFAAASILTHSSVLCCSLLSRSQCDVNRLNLRSGNGSVLPGPGFPTPTRIISAGRDGTQVRRLTSNGIPVRTRKRYRDIGDVVGIYMRRDAYVSSLFFSRFSVSLYFLKWQLHLSKCNRKGRLLWLLRRSYIIRAEAEVSCTRYVFV